MGSVSSLSRALALAAILLLVASGRAAAAAPDAGVAPAGEGTGQGASAADAGTAAATEGAPSGTEPSAAPGLFEQSTAAAAGAAGAASPGPAPLNLTGYVRGDAYVGKIPGVQQAELKAAYGEVALVARTAKQPYGDGFAEMRLRYGLQGDLKQTFVDVREAYANAYLGPVDLRLGKQIIVWGRADLLNPTNNLTPNDLRIRSPIEDDRRVGNVGARAFLRLSPVRFEAVWLPSYVPSELPQVYLPQFVSFGTPDTPGANLKSWLEAGRLHLELPSFEMSVSYLYGYAPLPGLALGSLTFDPVNPSIVISRTAYKHQVVGFDFSTALGDIVAVRGEAAYRRPLDYQGRSWTARPDLQYALGLDHTFGPVMVIVQYLGRYVFDWKKEGPIMDYKPSVLQMDPGYGEPLRGQYTKVINSDLAKFSQMMFSQTARVQHLATARVEWLTLHDTLSISALGMVNFSTKEWMTTPKIGYRLSDTMIAYVGAEVGSGPSGTIFGLADQKMSAGYAELRATF
jgi:hypothetical protein